MGRGGARTAAQAARAAAKFRKPGLAPPRVPCPAPPRPAPPRPAPDACSPRDGRGVAWQWRPRASRSPGRSARRSTRRSRGRRSSARRSSTRGITPRVGSAATPRLFVSPRCPARWDKRTLRPPGLLPPACGASRARRARVTHQRPAARAVLCSDRLVPRQGVRRPGKNIEEGEACRGAARPAGCGARAAELARSSVFTRDWPATRGAGGPGGPPSQLRRAVQACGNRFAALPHPRPRRRPPHRGRRPLPVHVPVPMGCVCRVCITAST